MGATLIGILAANNKIKSELVPPLLSILSQSEPKHTQEEEKKSTPITLELIGKKTEEAWNKVKAFLVDSLPTHEDQKEEEQSPSRPACDNEERFKLLSALYMHALILHYQFS